MKNKNCYLLVCLLTLFTVSSASAQIGMRLKVQQVRNLNFNPIWIQVEMENLCGNTLNFPLDWSKAGLDFELLNSKGKIVSRSRYFTDAVAGLTFASGTVNKRKILLSNLFTLYEKGSYTCRAVIYHKFLPKEYVSNTVVFLVDAPPVIDSFKVGVPLKKGETKIRRVTYSVMLFEEDKAPVYYIRVEDERLFFANIRLQLKNSSYPPSFMIDSKSKLHAFVYNEGKVFTHYVINTSGTVESKDTYVATDTNPRLVKDPDIGRVMIIGGRIGKSGVDYLDFKTGQRKYELERQKRLLEKKKYFDSQK